MCHHLLYIHTIIICQSTTSTRQGIGTLGISLGTWGFGPSNPSCSVVSQPVEGTCLRSVVQSGFALSILPLAVDPGDARGRCMRPECDIGTDGCPLPDTTMYNAYVMHHYIIYIYIYNHIHLASDAGIFETISPFVPSDGPDQNRCRFNHVLL